MKAKEKITFFGLSDMGKQRTNNEDAFVVEKLDEYTILAVAIDGVGGYEGGEVAAEIAQTEIPQYMHEFQNGERLELLKQAVISANNAIYERRKVDTARSSMSCVLTAALVDSKRKVVEMVHVGDTRLYQFHHGNLTKISHDHSLIGYREEIGDLTEEEAMHHPQRNVISRDVGSGRHEVEDPDFLEVNQFPLLPNSTILLCSDGLTDLVRSYDIKEILGQNISLKEKVLSLINAANDAGGKDNITVVLVEYNAEEECNSIKGQQIKEEKPHVVEVEDNKSGKDDNQCIKNGDSNHKSHKIMLFVLGLLLGLLIGLLSLKKEDKVPEKVAFDYNKVLVDSIEDDSIKGEDKEEKVISSESLDVGNHEFNGFFITREEVYPIELSFTVNAEKQISECLYKNITFGGIIKMEARTDDNLIVLRGKDGKNDFEIILERVDYSMSLRGTAYDGDKILEVVLYENNVN